MPHSHQNLSCLRNGVDYSRFIGNDTAEELLTPLLRQFNFVVVIALFGGQLQINLRLGQLLRTLKY